MDTNQISIPKHGYCKVMTISGKIQSIHTYVCPSIDEAIKEAKQCFSDQLKTSNNQTITVTSAYSSIIGHQFYGCIKFKEKQRTGSYEIILTNIFE